MKYSQDIKLEICGKFINGDYHKNLKPLTKDLDKLIKSAKSEQLLIQRVSKSVNCEHIRGSIIERNNEWLIECRKCRELY
jgi:hypothetical protein